MVYTLIAKRKNFTLFKVQLEEMITKITERRRVYDKEVLYEYLNDALINKVKRNYDFLVQDMITDGWPGRYDMINVTKGHYNVRITIDVRIAAQCKLYAGQARALGISVEPSIPDYYTAVLDSNNRLAWTKPSWISFNSCECGC